MQLGHAATHLGPNQRARFIRHVTKLSPPTAAEHLLPLLLDVDIRT